MTRAGNFRMNWYGAKVTASVREAGVRGLINAAEHLLEHSNRTVPHDEGTLERSGTVWPDTVRGVIQQKMSVFVSYDTKYAARLHESAPGEFRFRGKGQRKWLERSGQERQAAIRKYVGDAIKKGMRGGV